MNWIEFSSSVIGYIISWPVVAFLVAMIFREPISDLIANVKAIKSPIGDAEFGRGVKELEEQQRELSSLPQEKHEPDDPFSPADLYEEVAPIAEHSPSAAVVESWRRIEQALVDLCKAKGVEVENPRRTYDVLRQLGENNIFTYELSRHLDSLRRTRNSIAHSSEQPTTGEAMAYVDVASSAYAEIKNLSRD
ncbi:hypothetical protein GCM10007079_27430 [Nocardiopsis terrae]|uniref:Phosphate/sulfate permease n=1 Tax=Nocardiopsis terrae TaxID=372655 RepID=A0ABR9HF46_9ACTN|nr:DUF4145 domain-containing protein [Nocardiopsis terrae]MBE1457654.1 phosphate/sulfate permease [Nocardiopsis terrae]GHC84951.1 hypothetical protein GCM10007079_27430 [Nocardiopsis terrae]